MSASIHKYISFQLSERFKISDFFKKNNRNLRRIEKKVNFFKNKNQQEIETAKRSKRF